jgi:hypothetical protein
LGALQIKFRHVILEIMEDELPSVSQYLFCVSVKCSCMLEYTTFNSCCKQASIMALLKTFSELGQNVHLDHAVAFYYAIQKKPSAGWHLVLRTCGYEFIE